MVASAGTEVNSMSARAAAVAGCAITEPTDPPGVVAPEDTDTDPVPPRPTPHVTASRSLLPFIRLLVGNISVFSHKSFIVTHPLTFFLDSHTGTGCMLKTRTPDATSAIDTRYTAWNCGGKRAE